MDIGVFVPSVPYIGSVLVVGLFLWRVFARLHADMGTRFERMEGEFDRTDERLDRVEVRLGHIEVGMGSFQARLESLDGKVDGLSEDHGRLSREVSEFRGEVGARLATLESRWSSEP